MRAEGTKPEATLAQRSQANGCLSLLSPPSVKDYIGKMETKKAEERAPFTQTGRPGGLRSWHVHRQLKDRKLLWQDAQKNIPDRILRSGQGPKVGMY